MSNSTPPGWYPVPGADGTPGHERWWDGNAWTSDVRPLQGGAGQLADAPTQWQPSPQQPGYGYPGQGPDYGYSAQGAAQQPGYGYPGQEAYPGAGYGYPGAGYPQPAPDRTKPGVIIGIAVAVLAVGGIIAGIALSQGGDSKADPTPAPTVPVSRSDSPSPTTTPSPTPTGSSPTVAPPKPAPVLRSTVPDPQHAISVPLFDGWEASTTPQHSTVYLGNGRYTCADGNQCIRGQFSIEKDTIQGATAKAAADTAMPVYAGQIFSGVTSHTDSGSGSITVAGVSGYATRWHIRTSDGTQGYVVLAAVPARGGGYVVFEGGVDDDPAAPDASVLDQILWGIKQDGSAGSST